MFAYLDFHTVTTPARVGHVCSLLQDVLYRHGSHPQVWNSGGTRPEACDALERVARAENPRAVVRKGSDVPSREQGIKILGTPLGHPEFVSAYVERTTAERTPSFAGPDPPHSGRPISVVDFAALRGSSSELLDSRGQS